MPFRGTLLKRTAKNIFRSILMSGTETESSSTPSQGDRIRAEVAGNRSELKFFLQEF